MTSGAPICTPTEDVLERVKKFRMMRDPKNSALISTSGVELVGSHFAATVKVDVKEHTIIFDDELVDVTLEELQDSLPDSVPRYIIYVYKYTHQDGRVSFPLSFIYYAPPQIKPNLAMMYSSSLQPFFAQANVQKMFEVRHSKDLTEEWLKSKLSFFH
eukprot:TRINITY_DN2871_c0_g1_i2.p1 TRINITY_DN2871_c0_g1~~TRINITY_DN2871_c0_g1_i2.p1  ORF type:complete len:158 (-),score=52.92 TRINITY_DN2871_c0_g1_i2:72-545(-)